MDVMFAAPDLEALGGDNPDLDELCALLRTVPVEPAMFGLAGIAAATWHAGQDQSQHLALAEEVFAGRPVLDRLKAFLNEEPQRVVFNEQHLTILTRLLLIHGAEGDARNDLTNSQVDALLTALLGVGGLTERHADTGGPSEPLGWVPWLVRSGLYFDRSNLGSDQGRMRALFTDLATAADPNGANWCDVGTWLTEDLASFHEQLGYGYAMGAFTKALSEDVPTTDRFIGIVPDGLLEGNMEPGRVERLVAASSATRAEYVEAFAADDVDHLLWDRTPFEKRPFLRLTDGRLVLLSPRFLHSWMGEGFYYRLLDAASNRPDPARPSKSAALRFTRFHGELMERYVERLARDSHRDQVSAGVAHIATEHVYTGKDGSESKSPDLLMSYATDLVAIEVTGGRPARRTRVLSDPGLIAKELDDRVIGKLAELDRALSDVLDGLVDIPELRLDLVERIWPVLIVPATIIQSDFLWDYIRARSPELFADKATVQAPTLFSIEDFEHALAAVETGAGLPAILGTRLGSAYSRMPPSHFFARHFKADRRPAYLDEHMRRAGEEAATALNLSRPQ